MKKYLCEISTMYGLRKWVEAEGPSQAAVAMAESQYGEGRARVIVHGPVRARGQALEPHSVAFDVTVARGRPSSVKWIRTWEDV